MNPLKSFIGDRVPQVVVIPLPRSFKSRGGHPGKNGGVSSNHTPLPGD